MPRKKESKEDNKLFDDLGKLAQLARESAHLMKGFNTPSRILAYELIAGDSIKLDDNESVLNSYFDESKKCWFVLVKREIE